MNDSVFWLAVAGACVWLGVGAYLVFLGVSQNALARRARALEADFDDD